MTTDPLTQRTINQIELMLGRPLPPWIKTNIELGPPAATRPHAKPPQGNTTLDPPTLISRLDTLKRRARIGRDRALTSTERAQWTGRYEAFRDARDLVEQSLIQEQIA